MRPLTVLVLLNFVYSIKTQARATSAPIPTGILPTPTQNPRSAPNTLLRSSSSQARSSSAARPTQTVDSRTLHQQWQRRAAIFEERLRSGEDWRSIRPDAVQAWGLSEAQIDQIQVQVRSGSTTLQAIQNIHRGRHMGRPATAPRFRTQSTSTQDRNQDYRQSNTLNSSRSPRRRVEVSSTASPGTTTTRNLIPSQTVSVPERITRNAGRFEEQIRRGSDWRSIIPEDDLQNFVFDEAAMDLIQEQIRAGLSIYDAMLNGLGFLATRNPARLGMINARSFELFIRQGNNWRSSYFNNDETLNILRLSPQMMDQIQTQILGGVNFYAAYLNEIGFEEYVRRNYDWRTLINPRAIYYLGINASFMIQLQAQVRAGYSVLAASENIERRILLHPPQNFNEDPTSVTDFDSFFYYFN